MSDIIVRLLADAERCETRHYDEWPKVAPDDCKEAAAEIKRLRLALAQNLVDRMGFAPESLEPELRAAYQQRATEPK